MKQSDQDLKYAILSNKDIESIKDLEKMLGDICLIAVEKIEALYVLEAKTAPNVWEPVDGVYPEISRLKAYYSSEDSAKLAKSALKNLLNSHRNFRAGKRPIRVRKTK